jgi:hypothetical protein
LRLAARNREEEMKAIQIQSHGGPEVLNVVTLPDPTPASGELLVRVTGEPLVGHSAV